MVMSKKTFHNQFHPSMCSACQQMDVLNNKALIHANHMPKVRAFDQLEADCQLMFD